MKFINFVLKKKISRNKSLITDFVMFNQGPLGSEALLETHKDREEMRKEQKRQNMVRRIQEAELLVGSLIVDKPDLLVGSQSPQRQPSVKTSTIKLKPRSASLKALPVQSRTSSAGAAHKILKPTIARRGPAMSTKDMIDRTQIIDDIQVPRRGILKSSRELEISAPPGGLDADLTMGSSTELLDYALAVEQMEREQLSYREPQKLVSSPETTKYVSHSKKQKPISVPERRKPVSHPEPSKQISHPEPEQQVDVKPYKPKSFKQLVKLQRPEITRKVVQPKPDGIPMPGPTIFEQNISQSRQTTARDSVTEEKMRMYGE